MMIKTLLAVLLSLTLVVLPGEARTINIEASVACRPELLPFLPGRVREVCASLGQSQPSYYFNSGQVNWKYFSSLLFIVSSANSKER